MFCILHPVLVKPGVTMALHDIDQVLAHSNQQCICHASAALDSTWTLSKEVRPIAYTVSSYFQMYTWLHFACNPYAMTSARAHKVVIMQLLEERDAELERSEASLEGHKKAGDAREAVSTSP